MSGVSNIQHHNGTLSFFYKGDINAITARLCEQPISDLTIEEPTLEEIFLHYYK